MIERKISSHIKRLFSQYPVVTLTGPRQSGKTTLCKTLFPNLSYKNLEIPEIKAHAENDPHDFLDKLKEKGGIIDEIQRVPKLTSYIQDRVDQTNNAGQFILTGSQQFEVIETVNQSLAGRTATIKLLPLSLEELENAQIHLNLNQHLYMGGYPRIFDKKLNPTEHYSFYLNTYVERDIRTMKQIHNLDNFTRFIRLCAGRIGNLLNLSELGSECGIEHNTAKSWFSVLQASYIAFPLSPHFKNFNKRVTKTPKIYFYDTGFAAYLLGINSPDQLETHPLRGALFENLIITEYFKASYARIKVPGAYFYRDHAGHEIDLILDQGLKLRPVEIKSSKTLHQSFFSNLSKYQKVAGNAAHNPSLIYSGSTDEQRSGVQVFSYLNTFKLAETL